MSYFQKIDIGVRSNQLLKYNGIKVLQTSYDTQISKITHFAHIPSLNSLLKRPQKRQNSKKIRDFEPRLRENEALNHKSWTLALFYGFGGVFSTFYFSSYFCPLKSLRVFESHPYSTLKKVTSRLLLKIDPKTGFWPFFQRFGKVKWFPFF